MDNFLLSWLICWGYVLVVEEIKTVSVSQEVLSLKKSLTLNGPVMYKQGYLFPHE